MSIQHINSLKVENFKCFNALEVSDFKQVNLLGGKNNVGKTSLLEAIELVSSDNTLSLISQINRVLLRRQDGRFNSDYVELDIMHSDSQYLLVGSNLRTCTVQFHDSIEASPIVLDSKDEVLDQGGETLSLSVNDEERKISIERLLKTKTPSLVRRNYDENSKNVNFVKSSKTDEREIALLYGALVDLNKEEFLNRSLSTFDENLISIKQRATERGVILKIQKRDKEHPVLLSSLGDGVNRYIAILCAVWASKDGILLIDEVENGIHYSNYGKLWKLIFQASKDANCQLFITSHSKECIEAFNKHQVVDSAVEAVYFEVFKSKKSGSIKASPRSADQLKYALSNGGEIRGE